MDVLQRDAIPRRARVVADVQWTGRSITREHNLALCELAGISHDRRSGDMLHLLGSRQCTCATRGRQRRIPFRSLPGVLPRILLQRHLSPSLRNPSLVALRPRSREEIQPLPRREGLMSLGVRHVG